MGLVFSRDKPFSCTTYDEKSNNEANDKGDSGEDDNPKEAAIVTWLMRVGGSVLGVVHTTYIDAGSATGETESAGGSKYYSSIIRRGRAGTSARGSPLSAACCGAESLPFAQ